MSERRHYTAEELASLRERLQVKIGAAAALLDVDERTIRRLIERGELPSISRGRMRRIRLADLLDWQRRNRNGGRDE